MSVHQDPNDFLQLVQERKRGRLKLYIGYAAGVGKTWQILQEAHALRERGVDIVIGLIEPHGRVETAALVGDLEVVPRRRTEYRGLVVEDMDLDGVLARRPEVAIVDEIPHTNIPGSRHNKRYQDVLEILDAGINVIGSLNIQHLESLRDLIERTTGVKIRETVPDTFLKRADQIVNVDLTVEDLRDRLENGKIYPKERITAALENLFRESNLATLRELALREVAENVERKAPEQAEHDTAQGTGARVMVCIASSSPRAAALLRRASRLAGRLNTDWFAVYVETPQESPRRIDTASQLRLEETIQMAKDLGAEVVRLQANDPATALLDFARSHAVGYIVIGRSNQPWWHRVWRGSVMERLVRDASGFDLHIVSFGDEEGIA